MTSNHSTSTTPSASVWTGMTGCADVDKRNDKSTAQLGKTSVKYISIRADYIEFALR
jgi:hypothetical protein